jgi:hypothetical protein
VGILSEALESTPCFRNRPANQTARLIKGLKEACYLVDSIRTSGGACSTPQAVEVWHGCGRRCLSRDRGTNLALREPDHSRSVGQAVDLESGIAWGVSRARRGSGSVHGCVGGGRGRDVCHEGQPEVCRDIEMDYGMSWRRRKQAPFHIVIPEYCLSPLLYTYPSSQDSGQSQLGGQDGRFRSIHSHKSNQFPDLCKCSLPHINMEVERVERWSPSERKE